MGAVGGVPGDFEIYDSTIPYRGDTLDVVPNKINLLLTATDSGTSGAAITNTITHQVVVTPRWGIH